MDNQGYNAFFFKPPIENNFIGHIVAEVFKDRVYDPYMVGKKDLTIIDAGGNIGITSYYFSRYAKVVHTLEPASEHFATLSKMVEFNNLTNVIPHNMALANFDGDGMFYHHPNKTMWSLSPANADPNGQHETVKCTRLDTFMEKNNIDHVDFFKCDIEGSEAEVLCGEGFQNVGDKINILFLELHSWTGRNPSQIKDALKMAGFKTVDVIPNEAILWIARK